MVVTTWSRWSAIVGAVTGCVGGAVVGGAVVGVAAGAPAGCRLSRCRARPAPECTLMRLRSNAIGDPTGPGRPVLGAACATVGGAAADCSTRLVCSTTPQSPVRPRRRHPR